MASKKEVIVSRKTVLSGTNDTIEERVKGEGTIEEVRIRFYSGEQLSLKINPYVEHKGEKNENLLTYPKGTDNFITGDDDPFVFPVCVPVSNDDIIKIFYENTGTAESRLAVDIVVDYYAGRDRVVGGVING